MTDTPTPTPSAALIAGATDLIGTWNRTTSAGQPLHDRAVLHYANVNSIEWALHNGDRLRGYVTKLRDALAAAEPDATRWRRAVAACLPGQTPASSVECVSHLALVDAEQEIAALRAALSALVTLDGAVEALRKVMEQKP